VPRSLLWGQRKQGRHFDAVSGECIRVTLASRVYCVRGRGKEKKNGGAHVITSALSSLRRRRLLPPRTFRISLGPPARLHFDSRFSTATCRYLSLCQNTPQIGLVDILCRSSLRAASLACGWYERRLSAALRPARECVRGILVHHCCTLRSSLSPTLPQSCKTCSWAFYCNLKFAPPICHVALPLQHEITPHNALALSARRASTATRTVRTSVELWTSMLACT
jgi:hypothetical protein